MAITTDKAWGEQADKATLKRKKKNSPWVSYKYNSEEDKYEDNTEDSNVPKSTSFDVV